MARPFIIYIIAEGGIHMALIHTIVNYYDRHQILPERELRFMQYTLEALWNECIKTVLFGLYFWILDAFLNMYWSVASYYHFDGFREACTVVLFAAV